MYKKEKTAEDLLWIRLFFPSSGRSDVYVAFNFFLAASRIEFSHRFHGIYWTGIFIKNAQKIF
ncbi:hypothetical protein RG963_02015 [Methanosarcina sp. Z-7115]|uniref:Uncharacterized protein n=1 Tax=Methanosarcina baikalica TaxID=3073890 RepID=A0ABU2CXX8_9EURY|nr:hypothetical protein [Methanosarcina sp. Z-7115]MDR7664578.1 hypothetical protein [Methanosarcina sp. Z-7115]